MKAAPVIAPRDDHGTRVCYVGGCRCAECRAANLAYYHARVARMRELAPEVQPTGPSIPGTMPRGGRLVRIRRCPGANGDACVRGGSWLRGKHVVCSPCIERATVWDGLVPADRARAHLRSLSAIGVGFKAVAAASDVAASALGEILSGARRIRATTERKILAVDAGARADGAVIDAAAANERIADLRARGFTLHHLARLLGYGSKLSALQLGGSPRITARRAAHVEKLWRRVERGEVTPERYLVDARAERAFLSALLDRGVPHGWLTQRLGFHVQRSKRAKMLPANAERVRAFRAELDEIRREGTGMPDGWESVGTSGISRAFGFDGGWSWGGTSPGGRAPKKKPAPKPKKAPRPQMTAEERRIKDRDETRARRAAMDPVERRAAAVRHTQAYRARKRARAAA